MNPVYRLECFLNLFRICANVFSPALPIFHGINEVKVFALAIVRFGVNKPCPFKFMHPREDLPILPGKRFDQLGQLRSFCPYLISEILGIRCMAQRFCDCVRSFYPPPLPFRLLDFKPHFQGFYPDRID